MSQIRHIKTVLKSEPTLEGAGVHLKRGFGFYQIPTFDPFLLLDDFHSDNPAHYISGFPWHPHRGIETITYVLHGHVEHGDSLGNQGVIGEGDVQWMTAGSGIIHQEMPKSSHGTLLWGFQLWANLPAAEKMMNPRYREITKSMIPVVRTRSDIEIRIICGTIGDVSGPVTDIVIQPEYLDVSIPPDRSWTQPVETGKTLFAYVISGKAFFDSRRKGRIMAMRGAYDMSLQDSCMVEPESVVLYEDGEFVEITTTDLGVRFLLISGKPLREPIAWHGPIVMNTDEELVTAFREYREGTFIKLKG
jgi:redox-sensitive bicupin YhaK (pirin superfamily)